MNKIFLSALIISFTINNFAQFNQDDRLLIIRCDDIGMSHSVNMAIKELAEKEIKLSASVMVPCPWFEEAVEILKDKPNVSAGIHLTLNSEWKNYRWGPVAGVSAVPSLVDSLGYFFPSRASFFANNPVLTEVETELRAQIDKAIKSGLKVTYLDYHMGTAVDTPDLRKIVEKLALEYKLAISRYFNENDVEIMYSVPIDEKQNHLINVLDSLQTGKLNLLVCHIGKDNDELAAMIDMNSFGLKEMSKHREAELSALLYALKINAFENRKIILLNYSDLVDKLGLEKMVSPIESGY